MFYRPPSPTLDQQLQGCRPIPDTPVTEPQVGRVRGLFLRLFQGFSSSNLPSPLILTAMNWHDRWTLYVDSKALQGTFCIHELDVLTDDQLAVLGDECNALLEEWGTRKWHRKDTYRYFSQEIKRLQHQRLLG